MILDFQMTTAAFLGLQKNVVQTTQPCTPPIISEGPVQIVIDHVEFGANTLRHKVQGEYRIYHEELGEPTPYDTPGAVTQLAQEVTVYVTSLNDLLAHPNEPPSIIVPIPATVVVNLAFYAGVPYDQTCYFEVSFAGIEPGPVPFLPPNFDPNQIPLPININAILNGINGYISSLNPPRKVPIDVLGLLPMRPGKFTIVNAGLSVDAQMERIAFRVQVNPPAENPDADWINFFPGFLDDRLQGADFSLFIQGAYICTLIETLVYDAIHGSLPDDAALYITSNYSSATGKAVFENDLLGIYHLPSPLPDLKADPHFSFTISAKTPATIEVDAEIPDVQELTESIKPLFYQTLLLFLYPIRAVLQSIVGSLISSALHDDLPPQCEVTSATHIHCSVAVPLPDFPGAAGSSVTGVLALNDGPALTGSLRITQYGLAPVEFTAGPFAFVPPNFSCAGAGPDLVAAFANSPGSFNILFAQVSVRYAGTLPVYLCSITPLKDPLAVYPVSAMSPDSNQASLTINIRLPVPPPGFYRSPYPCVLLIKTTAGVQVVSIPPPPVVTQEDIDKLTAEMVVKLGNCESLVDPWFFHHAGLNPKWGIDPLNVEGVMHLWQVQVRGLQPEASVTLNGLGGREIVTAVPREGSVDVSALVAPAETGELSIMHVTPQRAPEEVARSARRGIGIVQHEVIPGGAIPLPHPCLELRPTRINKRLCAVAVMEDVVRAYSFDNRNLPSVTASWPKSTARGIREAADGTLLFGEDGLEIVDERGKNISKSQRCQSSGITHAIAVGAFIYAAEAESVGVYTSGLCRLRDLASGPCSGLIALSGKLVAANPNGLLVYDLTEPRRPRVENTFTHIKVKRLSRPTGVGHGAFLAMLDDQSWRILRLTEKGIEETATFPEQPWFDRVLRLGGTLVQLSANRMSLDVSKFGRLNVI